MVGEALLISSRERSRSWRLSLAIATFGESTHGYDRHANSLMLLGGELQVAEFIEVYKGDFRLSRLNHNT
jgi:hypothetical protein